MKTKFYFLKNKYPKLYHISRSAEILSVIDTGSCLSKCRLFIEEMVEFLILYEKIDHSERATLSDKLHALSVEKILPPGSQKRFYSIRNKGNKGAHSHYNQLDARLCHETLKECYQLAVWFIYTYEKNYIEDRKYENLSSAFLVQDVMTENKNESPVQNPKIVEKLESEIEKAPSFVGSMEIKIKEMNEDYEEVKKRRKRSKKFDKTLAWSGLAGVGLGTAGALALGVTPVGLATGLISGLGYLAYKYREDKKDKD